MRILVHDYGGHPFQIQLSRELARRGHAVLFLYFGQDVTPHAALDDRSLNPLGLEIKAINLSEPFEKFSFIKRRAQTIRYGKLVAHEIHAFLPEIVISANTPLDAQKSMQEVCRAVNARFINWVQDLYGVGIRMTLSKKWPLVGNIIGRYYVHLEKQLLRKCDGIVVITEDFVQMLERWRIDRNRISVIPNWAPIEEIPPCQKQNKWSRRHHLSDSFNFVYTGTLGMKHNPEHLIGLAERFRTNPDIRIIVLSEGPGADRIRLAAEQKGLDNLLVFGFQPFQEYPEVLAAADVLIAVLEKDAGVFSVPSKVLSYLCAQRPLLLAVPMENLAARIVQQHNAGIVVAPDDAQAFLDGAERMFADGQFREYMGMQGRRYAEEHFDIHGIADRFEHILNGAMA